MKKLSILLVMTILIAGFAFAQEEAEEPQEPKTEFFNMEVGIAFPVHWTSGMHDENVHPHLAVDTALDKTVTANIALNFAMNFNFSRVFGLTLDLDIFYGTKLVGYSDSSSDNVSLFGANIFFGPTFYLYNSLLLRVPLSIGGHMYYYQDDVWNPNLGPDGEWLIRKDTQIGAALSLAVQFHFSRDIYIFSKTFVAVDFLRNHSMTLYDGNDIEIIPHGWSIDEPAWTVRPSIGIGIKF